MRKIWPKKRTRLATRKASRKRLEKTMVRHVYLCETSQLGKKWDCALSHGVHPHPMRKSFSRTTPRTRGQHARRESKGFAPSHNYYQGHYPSLSASICALLVLLSRASRLLPCCGIPGAQQHVLKHTRWLSQGLKTCWLSQGLRVWACTIVAEHTQWGTIVR